MSIARVVAGLVGLLGVTGSAAEHTVSSAEEIRALKDRLRPGDVVVMRDGAWTDQAIAFDAKGTAAAPITLRAQTPGKVVLGGASSITVEGEHVVVSGLLFKEGRGEKEGLAIKGSDCRLTESAMVDCTYKFYVRLWGEANRMDHCYLAGKASEGPTVQVEAEARPNAHRIDNNHFGHRPPLRRNGGETIRVGYTAINRRMTRGRSSSGTCSSGATGRSRSSRRSRAGTCTGGIPFSTAPASSRSATATGASSIPISSSGAASAGRGASG